MSHYYALAIIPAEGDLDELLAETMGPVKERWTGETFEKLHDNQGIRDVLVKILYARVQAGLRDRVVVIDYHS